MVLQKFASIKSTSRKTSTENGAPSVRSRKSVIQGNQIFVWDRKVARSDEPYADKKYHIPFNPPPNEVNYIGGLGKNRGNPRSKVHPIRTTAVQQIYNMKHQNRIEISFTKPLEATNNCVYRKEKSNLMKLFNVNVLKKMVQKVSAADIVETASNSSLQSDVTENVILANRMQRKKQRHQQQHDGNAAEIGADRSYIDGKPFYMTKHDINQKANEIIDRHFDRNFSIKEVCSIDETSYRKWILEKQQQQKSGDTNAIQLVDEVDAISEQSSQKSLSPIPHRVRRKRALNSRKHPTLMHLSGYMYGKFSQPQQTRTNAFDRFGIPLSTIDKARKHQQKQKIQENVLRKVRLAQMGYHQPPSKDDSSDDESVQNVKRLALLRTPYFMIPTIRISQVKRKERLRNRFLQKERLNRINLLLYEHHKKVCTTRNGRPSAKRNVKVHFGQAKGRRFNFLSRCLFLKCGKKLVTRIENNPIKEKYTAIIQSKYKEQIKKCASNIDRVPSFDEFKKLGSSRSRVNSATTVESRPSASNQIPNNGEIDLSRENIINRLFRRKKHFRFRKSDAVDGPLYVDPFIMDKLKKPNKFNKFYKYYTNLFKGKYNIRNRLQVNDDPFEYGKMGIEDDPQKLVLPTEMDDYYVHEMRYRRIARKFCVKTDILKLREIVRQNFLMYYTQENLLELRSRQIAENRIFDNVEAFGQSCDKLFNGWTEHAYNEAIEQSRSLQHIQHKNQILRNQREILLESYDKLTKDILLSERQWDFLLRIQNYYYLLMDMQWRQQNDWIHRNETTNELLIPLDGIRFCGQRNIRMKHCSTAEAVVDHFENENIPHLEQMKQIQPECEVFQKNVELMFKKAFIVLNQNNKTIWTFKEIQLIHGKLKNEMESFKRFQLQKIDDMKQKQNTTMQRQQLLRKSLDQLLSQDIADAFSDKSEQKILGIIDVLYQRFMPQEKLAQQFYRNPNRMLRFRFIHQHLMDLLQTLDSIPLDILNYCEQRIRRNRRMDASNAKKAIVSQSRFTMLSKQIEQHFNPAAVFRRTIIRKVATAVSTKHRKSVPNREK